MQHLVTRYACVICIIYASFSSDSCADPPHELKQLTTSLVSSREFVDREHPQLLVHFHGAAAVTERNFHESGLVGILLTVNCQGLSSAYRRPFENETLFLFLLESVKRQLVDEGLLDPMARWTRIDVSCFSAGYGAVRELLKRESIVRRVDSVIAADSIYASISMEGNERQVDTDQMSPFVDFARLAIRGDKMFLMSHSQLSVDAYASTVETADHLLGQVDVRRQPMEFKEDITCQPISVARQGRFSILSFPGADGEAHLSHLREIAVLWKKLHLDRQKTKRSSIHE